MACYYSTRCLGNYSSLKISDYLINESKLLPRLAVIYDMPEEELDYTWSRGNYYIRSRSSQDRTFNKLKKVRTSKSTASEYGLGVSDAGLDPNRES